MKWDGFHQVYFAQDTLRTDEYLSSFQSGYMEGTYGQLHSDPTTTTGNRAAADM